MDKNKRQSYCNTSMHDLVLALQIGIGIGLVVSITVPICQCQCRCQCRCRCQCQCPTVNNNNDEPMVKKRHFYTPFQPTQQRNASASFLPRASFSDKRKASKHGVYFLPLSDLRKFKNQLTVFHFEGLCALLLLSFFDSFLFISWHLFSYSSTFYP